jgi:antitoxin component of MazEF toxin-antitoxin module
MRTAQLKVTRIGNSRGVRLPAETLRRYGMPDSVMMEERSEGIVLRPMPSPGGRLSWEDTAREMAGSGEDWTEWEVAAGDGIEAIPC